MTWGTRRFIFSPFHENSVGAARFFVRPIRNRVKRAVERRVHIVPRRRIFRIGLAAVLEQAGSRGGIGGMPVSDD